MHIEHLQQQDAQVILVHIPKIVMRYVRSARACALTPADMNQTMIMLAVPCTPLGSISEYSCISSVPSNPLESKS